MRTGSFSCRKPVIGLLCRAGDERNRAGPPSGGSENLLRGWGNSERGNGTQRATPTGSTQAPTRCLISVNVRAYTHQVGKKGPAS